MSSPAPRTNRLPEPQPGERWVRVSSNGQGLAVEIVRTTPNNVMFELAQGNRAGRGAHRTGPQTMKRALFLRDYVPARQESILERQATLRTVARQPGLVGQGAPRPGTLVEPTPVYANVTLSDNGVATCTCPDFVDKYSVDTRYACDHIRDKLSKLPQQQGDEPPGDAAVTVTERRGGRGHRTLRPEQAVEIFLLKGSGTYAEVARLYQVDGTTVKQIWERQTYKDATADLADPTVASQEAPVEEPAPPPTVVEEAPTRVVVEERKIESRRVAGRFYTLTIYSDGSAACTCAGFRRGEDCWHVRERPYLLPPTEPRTPGPKPEYLSPSAIMSALAAATIHPPAPEEEAAVEPEIPHEWATRTNVTPVIARASNDEVAGTAREAALYLETLVQYAGQPLPPLMTLDTAKVADIVARLRRIGGQ